MTDDINRIDDNKPGNVFEGKIVHVTKRGDSDLVTVLIAPGIELTVLIVRVPDLGGKPLSPLKKGEEITIGVPPPICFAFGGKNRFKRPPRRNPRVNPRI